MKKFKISILTMALFAFTLSMTACGGSSEHAHDNMEEHGTEQMDNHDGDMEEHGTEQMDNHDGDMEEHVYACPMHPEITGKEGDKCSKCGMDLKMPEHNDGDDEHEGHDHGDHEGHDH